jgi:pimeloyl-ACP methyl ester carboxylesterase
LHGWGANLGTFDQLASHLAQKFRVIRFDFPGFGHSPKPDEDWSVNDYARITRDFLQKLKVKEVHAVIAHSFGGRIVIKGISLDYFQPRKVVLIGTAGVKSRQSIKKNIYKGIAKAGKFVTSLPILKKAQPVLRKRLYSTVGSMDYLQAGQMKKIFLNTINEDLLPEVAHIVQPTLMIWGENDTETPLKDADSMLKLLKNGQLIVIPNTGHFVYIEANERVIKELESFLV